MLDHPFDDVPTVDIEATPVATVPAERPKVEVTFNGQPASVKELPPLTFEEIKGREMSYIGGNAPIENKAVFDGLLADYMAKRVIQATDSWYKIGEALSYMIERDVHSALGYGSIEEWLEKSLRKVLVDDYGCDKGVKALLQYQNYYDLERRLEDCSPEAVANLQEVLPGVSDYRTLNSMTSNPAKFLPGVAIAMNEDLKETLVEIAAEAIADQSMEYPDPDGNLPDGKSYRDAVKSYRRSALNAMIQETGIRIAAEIAQGVNSSLIKVNHFYEMLGQYQFFMEEPAKGNREGETKTELRKVSYDFKRDPWVEVMSYDQDTHTVTIRPWDYYALTVEERAKRHMDERGVLKKEVSICVLNLKDANKIGLTQEELEEQGMDYDLTSHISRGVVKTITKSLRNEEPSALGDMIAQFLEEYAVKAEAKKEKVTAEKKAQAIADLSNEEE